MLELLTQEVSSEALLKEIGLLDKELELYFKDKLVIQPSLNRTLVSFQANKTKPIYRWYKYKEAFSAILIEHLLQRYCISKGKLLDPFAGSGTSLFAASTLGLDADGIELLPIGQLIINTKQLIKTEFTADDFEALKRWTSSNIWEHSENPIQLPELRITKGAYPEETREAIEKFIGTYRQENEKVQAVLHFALLCILESISYTRKDGQYLRWDYRSNRRQGNKPFNKGEILGFKQAISAKINEILTDSRPATRQQSFFTEHSYKGRISIYNNSSLEVMPKLKSNTYDLIVTSPPYCNRYDYTRTYALELALLGIDEKGLASLRQQMLSCTVENRAKDLVLINKNWKHVIDILENQSLLQKILKYLDFQKANGLLNNSGIPRMVRGYFYEMACIIYECARVLKSNSLLFMVNDNVRYAGASVSVDLILSSIAENLGFNIENILVLPNGKGNSSQQMGEHGRKILRKCIYVWRKA